MRFIFCSGSFLAPRFNYRDAIVIQDENKTTSFILEMEKDLNLSKKNYPYYTTVLSKQKMILLRDKLNEFIELDN